MAEHHRETLIMAQDVRVLRQRLMQAFDKPIDEAAADDLRGRLEYVIEHSRLKPPQYVAQVKFTAPSSTDR